jgi:hypothetical protein
MRFDRFAGLAAGALICGCTPAEPTSPTAAPPAASAAAQQQERRQPAPADRASQKAERPICRSVPHDTGSRLSGATRVCLTREQWRQRGVAETQPEP